MTDSTMPALPEPWWRAGHFSSGRQRENGFTADQMHSYASAYAEQETAALRAALRAILQDPQGCRFCDSGKLRNASKPHDPECGFALADAAMAAEKS